MFMKDFVIYIIVKLELLFSIEYPVCKITKMFVKLNVWENERGKICVQTYVVVNFIGLFLIILHMFMKYVCYLEVSKIRNFI